MTQPMTIKSVINFFSPNDHSGLDEKQIPVSVEHFIQQPIMLFAITLISMTAFFGIDMFISSTWLIPMGIFQAVTALLLVLYNMGVVFTAIQLSFTYPNMKRLLMQKTSLLFINIPILALYLFIIKSIVF